MVVLLLCHLKMANWKSPLESEDRDVTNKIIKIQNIPKQLALSCIFQVRGELYTSSRTSNFS